jgi:type IV pilus assembly protein PilE
MNAIAARQCGRRGPRRMRGVTLLELMVVVVIIGILLSIAYPGYQSQIQKTRRADGRATLLDTAQRLERCFTRYNAYNDARCDFLADVTAGVVSDQGWYVVTDAAPAASTFSLVATRQNAQTGDTLCGNLTLTDRGVRGATGTAPVTTCW